MMGPDSRQMPLILILCVADATRFSQYSGGGALY